MKLLRFGVLALVGLLSAGCARADFGPLVAQLPLRAYEVDEITDEVASVLALSVVMVEVYTGDQYVGHGSGVIYKFDGRNSYVLTASHMVDGGVNGWLVTFGGIKSSGELVSAGGGTCNDRDWAILKFKGIIGIPLREVNSVGVVKPGLPVIAIGFPEGQFSILRGEIVPQPSWLEESGLYQGLLLHNAECQPGSSGGAIISMGPVKLAEKEVSLSLFFLSLYIRVVIRRVLRSTNGVVPDSYIYKSSKEVRQERL